MPPDCTTDLQREHVIQSNKKFKDFNFSLKLVTVADETTVIKVFHSYDHKCTATFLWFTVYNNTICKIVILKE